MPVTLLLQDCVGLVAGGAASRAAQVRACGCALWMCACVSAQWSEFNLTADSPWESQPPCTTIRSCNPSFSATCPASKFDSVRALRRVLVDQSGSVADGGKTLTHLPARGVRIGGITAEPSRGVYTAGGVCHV